MAHQESGGRFWAPLAVDYGAYNPMRSGSIDGTDSIPHDRAVVRATTARYKPNKQVEGDAKRTLFVTRLSHATKEETLKEMFSKYGKIESCRLVRDIVTGRPKGYAFVEFRHLDDANNAYHHCNKLFLDGARILVEMEYERTLPGWVPRRLGGGFGGKKESGQLRFGGRDRPFRKPIMMESKPLKGGGWRDREPRDFARGFSREQRSAGASGASGDGSDRRHSRIRDSQRTDSRRRYPHSRTRSRSRSRSP